MKQSFSCIRTLRLKIKRAAYPWLKAAAIEVNQVWNFANETSYKAGFPFSGNPKWSSAFDLNNLTAGAAKYFEWIDALHKYSKKIVSKYQNIFIGDVSSVKLARTRMAKSVPDAGWGMLKTFLQYKGRQAGRSVKIISERNTTRTCSTCGASTGPKGLSMVIVSVWVCAECGVSHDRDVNAARNILFVGRSSPSICGNEPSNAVAEPSQTYGRCEAGKSVLRLAA
jgi:IS605 OrfB family transposase